MKKIRIWLIFILLIAIVILGYFGYKRFTQRKIVDLTFTIGGKTLLADEAYIMIDGEYEKNIRVFKENDTYYLPFDIVKRIDSRFYYNDGVGELLFTTDKEINVIKKDSTQLRSGINLKNPIYIEKEGKIYLSFEAISQKGISSIVKFYENPSRIVVLNRLRFSNQRTINSDVIRVSPWEKSPILKKNTNENVYQLDKENGGYVKILTLDGYIGYVSKDKLSEEKFVKMDNDAQENEHIFMDKKIMLGFHQVTNIKANDTVVQLEGVKRGINVISPTWFSVKDEEGNITDISSTLYTTQMHLNGIRVWALVDDFTNKVDMLKVLSNSQARDNLINSLVTACVKADCDGINIDFETITKDSASHFIQFLRELYIKAHANNLIISVDNYSPKPYNSFYRIDEQASIVDYIVIMGYDENTSGPEAGSVSSYDFVKEGIETMLKAVKPNQVINAVPFYTRLWTESGKAENGEPKFDSVILAMDEQQDAINKLGATPKWDDNYKQNYAEIRKDAKLNKIWLEDAMSLKAKMQLIKDNNLAGVAMWKLGLETSDVWEVMQLQ